MSNKVRGNKASGEGKSARVTMMPKPKGPLSGSVAGQMLLPRPTQKQRSK